ncbi:MAG TPA: hypothetical protein VH208_06185 [Myxococcaceae bacterium]|nr:hypothetical protein [Myxococcaceae bacterium]
MGPRLSWLVAVCVVVVAAGCKGKSAPAGPPLGSGNVTSLSPAANDPSFASPFDATPSPDGKTIYFAALVGTDPAILSAPATGGGTATQLALGAPLISPFGIAIDSAGAKLFIADAYGTSDPTDDSGSILVVPVAGGAPSVLAGTVGYSPRGVTLVSSSSGDTVFFTGTDPVTSKAGVFSIPAAGGTAVTLAEGSPFVDPSGVAVTAAGMAFVVDTVATSQGTASVLQVSHGQVSALAQDLRVGYPGGIALSQDESAVLVSGLDPILRTDVVLRIAVAGGATTSLSHGIDTFQESAGLHRAQNAEVYAWADSAANNTGTVYVLK